MRARTKLGQSLGTLDAGNPTWMGQLTAEYTETLKKSTFCESSLEIR